MSQVDYKELERQNIEGRENFLKYQSQNTIKNDLEEIKNDKSETVGFLCKNNNIINPPVLEVKSNDFQHPIEPHYYTEGFKKRNILPSINFMDFSNFDNAWKTAQMLSKARCIPKEFWDNPADILVVVQFGHELDLSVMTSIQNIAIINNRPSVWGDVMLALCMRSKGKSGGFIDCIEVYDEEKKHWSCTSIRDGRENITRTFTLEDAENGGYLKKPGSWQTNRKRMMQCRSRSASCKDMYPDILKGLLTIEEMRDIEVIDNKSYQSSKLIKDTVESMKENLRNKLNLESSENA